MKTILLLLLSTLSLCAQTTPNQRKNTIPATNVWVAAPVGGILYDLEVYNLSASTLYVHIFNTNALPANGAFPTVAPVQLPANSTATFSYYNGRKFDTGITICTSTTPLTLTNGTASFKMSINYGGSQ
jgi:hypothetical protein